MSRRQSQARVDEEENIEDVQYSASPPVSPTRKPRDPNRRVNFEPSPTRYLSTPLSLDDELEFVTSFPRRRSPSPRRRESTVIYDRAASRARRRRETIDTHDRTASRPGRRRSHSYFHDDDEDPPIIVSRDRPSRSASLYSARYTGSTTSLHSRARRQSVFQESSSESDLTEVEYDEEDSDNESISSFGFDLPGQEKRDQGDLQGLVNLGGVESSESPAMSDAMSVVPSQKASRIIRSRFSSLEKSHDLTVEVTEGQSTGGDVETAPEPLFRWIHLDEESMDFNDFLTSAIQSPSLTVYEKRPLKQQLELLRTQHEKNLVSGGGCYMDPFVLQELSRSPITPTIVGLCLPYFHLDEYTTNVEGAKSTKHPPRTLLQSFMPSTSRERDMEQAVCKIRFAPESYCYHVSQIWCVVVNEKLIVTSARSDEKELCGSSVIWRSEPSPGFHHVQVSDGGNCLWQIRLEECETWFAFTANFMDIKSSKDTFMSRFEDRFKLTLNGRSVTPENWYKVVARARKSTVRLLLSRRSARARIIVTQTSGVEEEAISIAESEGLFPWQQEFPPPPPPLGEEAVTESRRLRSVAPTDTQSINSLTPSDTPDSKDSGKADHRGAFKEFCVLSWLFIEKVKPEGADDESIELLQVDEKKFNKFQNEIHSLMLNNKNHKEKKAYEECHEKELPDVTNFLALAISKDGGFVKGISTLERFFYAATDMFLLFMPLETKTSIANRYWGAVYFILRKITPLDSPVFNASIDKFILVSQLARIIREELSQGRGPRPGHVELPIEFQQAWLHCIAYLTLFKIKVKNVKDRDRHIETCQLLLYKGRQHLGRKLAQVPLNRKEVAVPQTILCIMIARVVKDITGGQDQLNITKTYGEYWKQLEADVKADRLKRAQPAIGDLQQEIKAIMRTLQHQLILLETLHEKICDQKEGWSLAHDNAPKRELPLLLECITHVKTRMEGFQEIDVRATELEVWNSQRIASTKDRQDKAIYAFTIVTIVFLPLSFVSGFLGMNTSDIRSTKTKQWVFWAAALPLTAVVILIALLWAGELGNAWVALLELFHISPGQFRYKYEKLPDRPKKPKKAKMKKAVKVDRKSEPVQGELPRAQTLEAWEKPYRRTQTYRSMLD